jgi:hypothetical protein
MLIGLSYSRCVLDIVEKRVDIDNVLVIIARTDFDPRDNTQWPGIWSGYTRRGSFSNPEWSNYNFSDKAHEDEFRNVSTALWLSGKLHQPRKFGAHPARRGEFWLETCLPSSELDRNPAAKDAWDRFQVIAGLTNVTLDTDYK